MNEDEERLRTAAKIRSAERLANGIRQLRTMKGIRALSEGEKQELDNKLMMARNILGMSGAFDLQEVLDALEKYLLNLKATGT